MNNQAQENTFNKAALISPLYRVTIVETIAEFEKMHKDAIGALSYRGLHIWPVVRSLIANTLVKENIKGKLVAPVGSEIQLNLEKEIKSGFDQVLGYRAPDIDFIDRAVPNLPEKIEACFFTFSENYNVWSAQGWKYNHPIENLFCEINKEHTCIKLEEYKNISLNSQPRKEKSFYFRTPWGEGVTRLKHKLFSGQLQSMSKSEKSNLDLILAYISKSFPILNTNQLKKNIFFTCQQVEAYANYFIDLLQKVSPNSVFFEFYYKSINMGLVIACKYLGIPSVEVQHGLIGTHSWPETHWNFPPEHGYFMLPDYFWVNDQFEAQNIIKNSANGKRLPIPIIGGMFHGAQRLSSVLSPQNHNLGKIIEKKYVILFALQFDRLPIKFLLNVITKLSDNVMVLVRFHSINAYLAQSFKNMIVKFNLKNVEVQQATSAPLVDVMKIAHHVITPYSTVARDALEYDKEVTVFDQLGKILFSQFIADDRIFYVENAEQLTENINASCEMFFAKDGSYDSILEKNKHFRISNLSSDPVIAFGEILKNEKLSLNQQALGDIPFFAKPSKIASRVTPVYKAVDNMERVVANKFIKLKGKFSHVIPVRLLSKILKTNFIRLESIYKKQNNSLNEKLICFDNDDCLDESLFPVISYVLNKIMNSAFEGRFKVVFSENCSRMRVDTLICFLLLHNEKSFSIDIGNPIALKRNHRNIVNVTLAMLEYEIKQSNIIAENLLIHRENIQNKTTSSGVLLLQGMPNIYVYNKLLIVLAEYKKIISNIHLVCLDKDIFNFLSQNHEDISSKISYRKSCTDSSLNRSFHSLEFSKARNQINLSDTMVNDCFNDVLQVSYYDDYINEFLCEYEDGFSALIKLANINLVLAENCLCSAFFYKDVISLKPDNHNNFTILKNGHLSQFSMDSLASVLKDNFCETEK